MPFNRCRLPLLLFAFIYHHHHHTHTHTHDPPQPRPPQTEQSVPQSGRTKIHVLHSEARIESTAVNSPLAALRPSHTWHFVLRLLTPRYRPAEMHHRTPQGGSGLLHLHPLDRPGPRPRRATGERL